MSSAYLILFVLYTPTFIPAFEASHDYLAVDGKMVGGQHASLSYTPLFKHKYRSFCISTARSVKVLSMCIAFLLPLSFTNPHYSSAISGDILFLIPAIRSFSNIFVM